eukprot:14304682-Ditylum_brightwellii.AAC.1
MEGTQQLCLECFCCCHILAVCAKAFVVDSHDLCHLDVGFERWDHGWGRADGRNKIGSCKGTICCWGDCEPQQSQGVTICSAENACGIL